MKKDQLVRFALYTNIITFQRKLSSFESCTQNFGKGWN